MIVLPRIVINAKILWVHNTNIIKKRLKLVIFKNIYDNIKLIKTHSAGLYYPGLTYLFPLHSNIYVMGLLPL